MMIVDAIGQVAPQAHPNYLQAIRAGGSLFDQNGLSSPLRMAHFMAQALHETGLFTIVRENMNYSAPRLLEVFGVNRHSAAITAGEAVKLAGDPEAIAERVYGLGNPRKALELGNTEPGDGFAYRGNGVLQMTGRGAHRAIGHACGVDFEGNPELALAPEHALKPALREWADDGLNAYADKNDIRTITLRINGGLNGFDERQALFKRLFPLLDAVDDVRALQQALNTLGTSPKLDIDGHFGPGTKAALVAFQTAAGIAADGVPGPATNAALTLRLGRTQIG